MATYEPNVPRAVIHRQILDSASSKPEASLEELASEVAGASTDLVERVLEEYGDPARDEPPGASTTEDEPMTDDARLPSVADLTEKERETLRAIAARPGATQGELADALGVSRATVNKRLNDIEGFEWKDRRAFVASVFGDEPPDAEPPDEAVVTTGHPAWVDATSDGGQLLPADVDGTIHELSERVTRLEQQLDGRSFGSVGIGLEDPALVAKLVRAVMADDAISDDEELRILEAVL